MNDEHKYTLGMDGHNLRVEGPWQFQLVVFVAVVVGFFWSVFWIMRDAGLRGKSGCLAFFFLFAATWPLSILWWLWLRPPLVKPVSLPPPPPPLPPEIL